MRAVDARTRRARVRVGRLISAWPDTAEAIGRDLALSESSTTPPMPAAASCASWRWTPHCQRELLVNAWNGGAALGDSLVLLAPTAAWIVVAVALATRMFR